MRAVMHYFEQTDSTNRIAKEMAAEGAPSGTVVRAACQSSGRGQHGRTFNSPLGGLYFSLLIEPLLPAATLPLIPLATGLACRSVLHQFHGLDSQIKWPNDLYLEGKKVAGILCENLFSPQLNGPSAKVIIGVGLNVNTTVTDYDEDIRPIITTILDQLQYSIDLDDLLMRLVESITAHVAWIGTDCAGLLGKWQEYDFLYHKRLIYRRGATELTGLGYGITADGRYRLVSDTGQEHRLLGGQLRPIMQGAGPSC